MNGNNFLNQNIHRAKALKIEVSFIEVKLEFFSFIAGHLEPQYRPMISFMYKDVHKIVSGLLKLFIEADVITVIKRGIDLISVDIHKKKNQLKEVVSRYSAQMKLHKMREEDEVNLEEISTFGMQCLIFLINVLENLFENAPIKYGFVRSCIIFEVQEMVIISSKKLCVSMLFVIFKNHKCKIWGQSERSIY